MLRRMLLGLVTALIVARLLLGGEDPGRTLPGTGTSGLVLVFFWLVAAVGWTIWRAATRRSSWYGSLVEAGLLAAVMIVSISSATASYKLPAWIIGWEWVALLVSFCLVRQLARSDADNRALLAVILASGVSLSAHALFQSATGPEPVPPPDPTLAQIFDLDPNPQPSVGATATFARPDHLAGFLVLIIPILTAIVSRPDQAWSWRRMASALCLLVVAGALVATHAAPALLCLIAVGLAAFALGWRPVSRGALGWTLAGAILVAALVPLALWRDEFSGLVAARSDSWNTTWHVFGDSPWLGVGPGNLSRYYARYLPSAAADNAADPHSFVLEMMATTGGLSLLALLAALLAFYWRVGRFLFSPVRRKGEAPAPGESGLSVSWEFYVGGIVGLSFGFLLRLLDQPSQDALLDLLIAGLRGMIWFAVFALLERVAWPARQRVLALAAGVAAFLLYLLVSDGISVPTLMQPMWIVAALALNAIPQAATDWTDKRMLELLPIPVAVAVCLGYLLLLVVPTMSAASDIAEARSRYPEWRREVEPKWQKIMNEKEKYDSGYRHRATAEAQLILLHNIIEPLQKADRDNPFDAYASDELGHWSRMEWWLLSRSELLDRAQRQSELDKVSESIIDNHQKIDPEGTQGYWVEYQLWLQATQEPGCNKPLRYRLASRPLKELVKRDRTEPRYHYLLAEACSQAGYPWSAKFRAEEALRLDEVAHPRRKLTAAQREQCQKWLTPPPPTPPAN